MHNKYHYVITSFLFILVIGLAYALDFFYKEQKVFKQSMEEKFDENKKGIFSIYSGMSLDEQRLVKIKQVQRIIKYSNDTLKPEMINSQALFIVNEMGKYPNLSNPFLICAWISIESNFDKNALSPTSAKGLTQIVSETGQDICEFLHWNYYPGIEYNMEKSIIMGFFYLNRMIDKSGGNIELGLTSYNGGFVMRNRYIMKNKMDNGDSLSVEQRNEVGMLSEESRKYANLIFKKEKEFENFILKP